MECTCDGGGHLVCMPCPDKPDGGGAGATTGAGGMTGGGGGATTGTAGTTGGMMCEPGATCQPGQRCGYGSPTGACMECTCDGGGHLVCMPCPDKPDGGGAGATTGTGGMTGGGGGATTGTAGTTGGGTMCEPGATCQPGQRCGYGSPTGACMECTCDGGGHFVCMPCPDKPDGGGTGATTGTGGTTGGGTMCAPGVGLPARPALRAGSPVGGCMECTCDPSDHYVCMPCPTGRAAPPAAAPAPPRGTAGTGGSATGPCDVTSMPAPDVGLPCSVNEYCPNGTSYRVRCDGATGACTCIADGVMKPGPAMSCATFDPIAALVGCGFPDGKL